MHRGFLISLGTLALAATVAVTGIHIVLAMRMPQPSSGRTSSKVAAVLEAAVSALLSWLLATYASPSLKDLSMRFLGIVFGVGLFAITIAATASVITIVILSRLSTNSEDKVMGTSHDEFLIGSSVALGLSFAFQLVFVVVHFVLTRASLPQALSLHSVEYDRRLPALHGKANRSTRNLHHTRELTSMESPSPPSSLGRKSTVESITTLKGSLSKAIRPANSKTQLLSPKEKRRPESLDSNAYRTSGEDSFDTWDTSSVDTHNRQVVFEASSPPHGKPHFLEPIPGSPTISRESSPIPDPPLEPPRLRTRSRSYSPIPSLREPPALTEHASTSELHIHPLFRSDSPTPPPMATPGTVVLAAPDAGKVITHRTSLRSLHSARSFTAPAAPGLLGGSRSSIESNQRSRDDQMSLKEVIEDLETEDRMMTPPIPEWVMGPRARSSTTG